MIEKGILIDGISRIAEIEDEIPHEIAQSIIQSKTLLQEYTRFIYRCLDLISRFKTIKLVWDTISTPLLVQSGSFKNTRHVFKMKGYTLEVDETSVIHSNLNAIIH